MIVVEAVLAFPAAWLLQHLLIAILIWNRAVIGALKLKIGIASGPRLARFVWPYYLTARGKEDHSQ